MHLVIALPTQRTLVIASQLCNAHSNMIWKIGMSSGSNALTFKLKDRIRSKISALSAVEIDSVFRWLRPTSLESSACMEIGRHSDFLHICCIPSVLLYLSLPDLFQNYHSILNSRFIPVPDAVATSFPRLGCCLRLSSFDWVIKTYEQTS